MARTLGITSTGLHGIVQKVNKKQSLDKKAEGTGADGKCEAQAAISVNNEISYDYEFDGDTPPAAGTVLTVNTKAYLIDSVDESEVNDGYQTGSISCSRKDDATQAAITA